VRNIIKYLLQGVLLIAPLALTILILVKTFTFLDSLLPKTLVIFQDITIGDLPGLGILVLVAILVFSGFLGSTFIAAPIQNYFQKLLSKAPLIKLLYGSVRELLGALVGNKKKFTNPVLIKENEQSNLNRIGFITQYDLSNLGIKEGYTSVYIPHSYAISGMLFIVENKYLTSLDAAPVDVMKFIISGGVLTKKNVEDKDIN
jgi:uncharacterized membrane protein|tara:strand:+ start:296 stop:901 length:606 start_codon:yes stop_codon:yes gene_type:complete